MITRALGIGLVLFLGLVSTPVSSDAQLAVKTRRIGFLTLANSSTAAPDLGALRDGLRQLGYVAGENLALEARFADWKTDRLHGLAQELARLNVDIIVVSSTPVAQAVKKVTTTIPIVFVWVGDPVAAGLVASLARPGGNLTGLSNLNPDLMAKRLELFKSTVPRMTRVTLLATPDTAYLATQAKEAEVAARALKLTVRLVEVKAPAEFEPAFARMKSEGAEGVVIMPDAMLYVHRARLAELARKSGLATIAWRREVVGAGGLLSYGASAPTNYRRAATYVDIKILKGARPDELPVENPATFELVVNLKTAKALGLTIPAAVLRRADEVLR